MPVALIAPTESCPKEAYADEPLDNKGYPLVEDGAMPSIVVLFTQVVTAYCDGELVAFTPPDPLESLQTHAPLTRYAKDPVPLPVQGFDPKVQSEQYTSMPFAGDDGKVANVTDSSCTGTLNCLTDDVNRSFQFVPSPMFAI